jgi:two-component system phosphate regulon sensor histidine kinase PhoR
MPKRRLMWQFLPPFGLLVLAAVLGFGWVALSILEHTFLQATRAELLGWADFLDRQLGPAVADDPQSFEKLTRRLDETLDMRVTFLLPDGRVAGDNRGRPEEFQNQRERAEIRAALAGRVSDEIRYNAGLNQRVFYLAVPATRDKRVLGVFYLSRPLGWLDRAGSQLQIWIVGIGVALAALAVPLAWRASRKAAEPMEQLAGAIERFGEGELAARVTVPDTREAALAAEAFNGMAAALQRRVTTLVRHNNEQNAVLAGMAEGVLAVDSQECIISVNRALSWMLGIDPAQAQGRRLQEVVRNADLSRIVSRALADIEPVEGDVLLLGDRERVMQAHGSALHDPEGRLIGAVIVLNDVTDFRRLEHIRRDFVANVSHELKTPVTSIKGFVETLLDGAMHDSVDSDRFLRIIAKQADRLHAIIEDLLALSKIEQSEESDDVQLEPTPLFGILESAVATCQTAARDKEIAIKLSCPPEVTANVNSLLLEQAVVNLLDNAIKYSEPRHDVLIRVQPFDGETRINVIDRGSGIDNEHIARIFERFYRVDRARSRKMGGTGLGLAIVKHIVQAHRGRVTVESVPGAGSTFTIHLPSVN